MIYDVSKHQIRIINNAPHVTRITSNTPLNIEGIVLKLNIRGGYSRNLYNKRHILELICLWNYRLNGSMLTRWDNDTKSWSGLGTGVLRSASISRCKNIWSVDKHLPEDHRPYHSLRPKTLSNADPFGISFKLDIPTGGIKMPTKGKLTTFGTSNKVVLAKSNTSNYHSYGRSSINKNPLNNYITTGSIRPTRSHKREPSPRGRKATRGLQFSPSWDEF